MTHLTGVTTPKDDRPATPARMARVGAIRRSPRDFVDMFVERWWIGLIAGALAAGLIVWFRPHFIAIYTTEVSLLFEARKDRVINIEQIVDTSLQTASELNTHMEQLRSKTFSDYVLASFNPAETEKIQKAYADPLHPGSPLPSLDDIIRPNVFVSARRGSPIVGITVSNRSPEAAALIANRYAHKYIDYNLDSANTRTNSAIETAENALQNFRAKNNLAPSEKPRMSSFKRWPRSARPSSRQRSIKSTPNR